MADISKITLPSGSTYNLKDASAITNITRSGTTFTATKHDGSTFTFTQQDNNTTYSAATQSAAGLMSADDKKKLDGIASGATSSGGTVTSVAASGSGGITISGSPITSSGTIAVGLNLSTAINGLGEGASPATMNDYAVVQYAGGGTTTTTYHRRKLSNILTKANIEAGLGYARGAANGVAPLNASSKIDSTYLPSYVDDVLEYDAKSNFPTTGEAGKIYVDTTTNLTYRWSGSAYVEISPSIAIGTTAETAAKGNHTHSVTAAGSVSQPTFTGTAATISVSKSYTPAGSVAAPTFTGTKATGLTVSPASSGTTTYTPEGTVSQPTFSGIAATISVSKSYTPAGTVSTPTISVKTAGSTTTVNSITAVGTLPSLTVTNQTVVTGTSVSGEVLSFSTTTNGSASGWSAGTLPTKGANTTVKTGDAAYQSSQPTFTGTAATITSTGSYTPAGTVSQPTFTGTGKRLVLQDYTPAGTNSAPAFTGTAATITSTGSYTPAGTVSKPSFTGSAVTTGTPA